MTKSSKDYRRIHHFITAICLALALILSYSLALGRGRAIPENLDAKAVRSIILTWDGQTRVLGSTERTEIETLLETLATMKLKPGLAPVLPDPEVAVMTIWFTRGKDENQYIFMENSVMQSQGLMLPHHYLLLDDQGMAALIRHIVSEAPEPTSSP